MCERCNDRGYIGLPSLPIPCDCGTVDRSRADAKVADAKGADLAAALREPVNFARICAFIGYSDDQCITTLLAETDLSADEAEMIVEKQYARYAAREANAAASEWLTSNADKFGKEE